MTAMTVYQGSLCALTLTERDGALAGVAFGALTDARDDTPLLRESRRQLDEYFAGSRKKFELPLAPEGTAFQKLCWQALAEIPYGTTATYGGIAAAIGRPKACRAVGMANHSNPIVIILPCHRVVGSDGSLTGFGGGLALKAALLELETAHRAK